MKVKQLIAALTECDMESQIRVQNVRDWRTEEEAIEQGTSYPIRTVVQSNDDAATLFYAGPEVSPDED